MLSGIYNSIMQEGMHAMKRRYATNRVIALVVGFSDASNHFDRIPVSNYFE